MLLVMDNCEHVAVAVAALTRMLLERCPRLTILATSRVELPAEYAAIVPLTPLALPPHDMVATAENVCRYSSAQLLEKAIANHRPEFRVTDENAAEVLRLCRLTGGLPLAIQIVGSVSGLTLAEIANQLEERGYVSLGESGSGCVARSDSVTGSVEWSLDLLSPGELKLFCRLGVFAGGWSREAAVKVAGEQNDDTPVTEACLNRLRACSLVEWGEAAGKSRYRMLEMLREVALRRLHESDLYYETSHRHLDYYVEKIEAIANVQNDAAREALLNSLGAEQDNLRVALDFAMESSMINKAVIISSGIARFCYMKGRHQEGHAWLDRVLAISAAAPPPVRLEALHGAATMAYMRNDYERAQQFWKECLELSRQVGNVPTELRTLGNLGSAAMAMDQFPAAKTYLEEALLGFERLQDIRGAARARAGLAGAASGMGDYATAQALYEHSITVFRAVADLVHLALHLCNLGDVLLKQDCITEAYGVLNEVIELNTRSENPRHLSHCLTIYVRLAARERDYARAAFLMGSEAALRDKIGFPLPMRAQVPYQQDVLNVVAHLGEEMFATLKNAGASTSLAEVRRFARIKR
jgi:predicted ATPase